MNAQPGEARRASFPTVWLENELMRVEVAPTLGGKIMRIESRRTGRQWLWANPHLPFREPAMGTDYDGQFDSGGWDEIFPTVAPCVAAGLSRSESCVTKSNANRERVRGAPNQTPTAWGAMTLTDHGELWRRPWRVVVHQVNARGAATLELALEDDAAPFAFRRTIELAPDRAELVMRYTLTNRSERPLPYLWVAHPLINIEPGMRIELPAGTQVRCVDCVTGDPPEGGQEFRWPMAESDGTAIDLSVVPAPTGSQLSGEAMKLFTEPLDEGWACVVAPDGREAFHFTFDPLDVPHVGLWLNYAGWSGAGTEPYFNLGLEPTTAACDSLAEAIDAGAVHVLQSRETARWSLTLSLSPRREER